MQGTDSLYPGQINQIPLLRNILLALAILYSVVSFLPVRILFNSIVLAALAIAAGIYLIVPGKKLQINIMTGEAYAFFPVWLAYAMLGLFWANDQMTLVSVLLNITIYFFIFVLFSQLLLKQDRQRQMVVFFQMMFLAYILIFVWEMATQNHLPTSRLYGTKLPLPTGPFFNENNTSSLCLMILPFLTVDSFLTRNKWFKGLIIIAVLIFLAVTIIQSARIVFLILIAYLVLYGIFKASLFSRMVAIGFLLLSLLVFINFFPRPARIVHLFVKYQYNSLFEERSTVTMTSLKVRQKLFEEGLGIATGSAFLGVGAGNFEDKMSSGRYHNTAWILNAHNFWLEMLANYGIFILAGMLYLYIRWLIKLGKLAVHSNTENRRFYTACFISMLFFIPMTFIPSTLRWFYPVWFYLAAMHAVSCNQSDSQGNKYIQQREDYEY